jgi:predicted DNA binding protein
MIEAVISMKLPGVWISNLINRFEVEVRILDTIPYGENGVQDLIEVKVQAEELENMVEFLEQNPDIEDVQLEIVEKNKAIGVIKCKMCFACRDLISSNCFLVSALTREDGRVEWTIIAPDNSCIQDLIKRLGEHDADPTIVKMKKMKEEEMLTEKQEQIIKMAYERGYYDTPKRVGLKDLANAFGVSQATLAETLRRGQKKIVEKYFEMK